MKKVIMLHGCPSDEERALDPKRRSYDKHWMPWLKVELEKEGIKVEKPYLPNPWNPKYKDFKEEFEKNEIEEETTLIGHSCSCAFLVRWLGDTQTKIDKLILVAPWKFADQTKNREKDFYEYEIDESVKNFFNELTIFTSDNEEEEGKKSAEIFNKTLGGEIIELKNHGHFTYGDMGTEEFPELLEAVLS